MILHQVIIGPEQFNTRLWPFAFTHTVYLWNHLPNDDGISPIDIYMSSSLNGTRLSNDKVQGCSAYVLNDRLKDGNT